jgi:hypothetical protein
MGRPLDRMTDTATYVYCLVGADRRPALKGVPRGLSGTGAIRLLELGRHLWLVVSDAPLDRYGSDAINAKLPDLDWVSRHAVDHESVIESFINARAVLPMKLFTLFSSDARAVEHMKTDRRRIDAALKRVAKRVEWGVRVVLDPRTADKFDGRESAFNRGARGARGGKHDRSVSSAGSAVNRQPPRTGASYLAQKKAQRDAASELAKRARAIASDLYDQLSSSAALARRRPATELPVGGGPMLLDAAFLVPHEKSTRFRALAERQARALAPRGYRVTVSGPWPPYSFIQE